MRISGLNIDAALRLARDAEAALHEDVSETKHQMLPVAIKDQHMHAKRAKQEVKGDRQLAKFFEMRDKLPANMRPNMIQKSLHKVFLQSLLPLIYGQEEFDRNREAILSKWNLRVHKPIALAELARRIGKTYAIIQFIVAAALSIDGFSVDVYAQVHSLSQTTIHMAKTILKEMAGDDLEIMYDSRSFFQFRRKGFEKIQYFAAFSARNPVVRNPVLFLFFPRSLSPLRVRIQGTYKQKVGKIYFLLLSSLKEREKEEKKARKKNERRSS